MISGRKLLAWVFVSWCLSHTLRSSWRLRPIRMTRLFCKSQFYPDYNAFWISLMVREQAISKRPLRVFQSPKVIPRKMTKYSSVTLVVKNLKLLKSVSGSTCIPSKNLLASQNIEMIMLSSHKMLKWCYWCKWTLVYGSTFCVKHGADYIQSFWYLPLLPGF